MDSSEEGRYGIEIGVRTFRKTRGREPSLCRRNKHVSEKKTSRDFIKGRSGEKSGPKLEDSSYLFLHIVAPILTLKISPPDLNLRPR